MRPADVDEETAGEPAEVAVRNARRKAAAVPGEVVLGADTVVAHDGEILGKPRDAAQAREYVGRLNGRTHEVVGGIALARDGTVVATAVEITRVISTAVATTLPSRASAIPPTTSCVRPLSRPRYSRACAASCGLPRIAPSSATIVSAPRTRGPGTAVALRRALASATAPGSPSLSSSTSAGRTSKAIPASSRIARRCGEADARIMGLIKKVRPGQGGRGPSRAPRESRREYDRISEGSGGDPAKCPRTSWTWRGS